MSSATDPEGPAVVAVVGAGTMGAGIAQVAAVAGHRVLLFDARESAADSAIGEIHDRLDRGREKGRWEVDSRSVRLEAVPALDRLRPADLVIEAIVEDLNAKRAVITELDDVVSPECILATNTSSLSPTALAAGTAHPHRVVGLHFFNPVPVMRLVEVVPAAETADHVVSVVTELAESWDKVVVRSAATPGFIVNRLARPYYAEAWRLLEERAADPVTIDAVLTRAGGFRMGPFALMDLIGHDVNDSVTRSVWSGFDHDPRFAPSTAQRALVEAGRLGRKAGRGVVRLGDEPGRLAPPRAWTGRVVAVGGDFRTLLGRAGIDAAGTDDTAATRLESGAVLVRSSGVTATDQARLLEAPVVVVDRTVDDATAEAVAIAASDGCPTSARDDAVGLLQAAGLDVHVIDDVAGLVVTRTVAMLVNLAVDAFGQGVATADDIDTAMRLGTNYPRGPLSWGRLWGFGLVDEILRGLQGSYGDPHYRPSPWLRRQADLVGRLSAPPSAQHVFLSA